MEALPQDPNASLPTDAAALTALVRRLLGEVAALRAENEALKAKLDEALRHRFGKKSERQRRPRTPPVSDRKPGRDDHGRAALPEHLPRRVVEYDLPEADKPCPCCGAMRTCIGSQSSEQL